MVHRIFFASIATFRLYPLCKITAFLEVFCEYSVTFSWFEQPIRRILSTRVVLRRRGGILRCSQRHVPNVVSPCPQARPFVQTAVRPSHRQASPRQRTRQRYEQARRPQEPSTRQHNFNRHPRQAHPPKSTRRRRMPMLHNTPLRPLPRPSIRMQGCQALAVDILRPLALRRR